MTLEEISEMVDDLLWLGLDAETVLLLVMAAMWEQEQ